MRKACIIVVLAGSALALPGCEWMDPKVTSPYSGQPVNEGGLLREAKAEEAKAKAEADAKSEAAAAEIRAAKAKAVSTAIALQQKQAVTVAEIQATAATVEAETGQRIAAATEAAAAAAKGLADRLTAIDEQADSALSAIAEKRKAAAGVLAVVADNPFVKTADAATGGALLGALGLAGGWLGRSVGSRKRHDASYDEGYKTAKAEAEATRQREDAAWDAAQAQLHAIYTPAPVNRNG